MLTNTTMAGESLIYTRPTSIDIHAVGNLYQARAGKKQAYSAIRCLRDAIRREPLGGNRHGLRVELLHVESAHAEWLRMERDALDVIERRANELGLTTKRRKPLDSFAQ